MWTPLKQFGEVCLVVLSTKAWRYKLCFCCSLNIINHNDNEDDHVSLLDWNVATKEKYTEAYSTSVKKVA
jgi:hypothetical protein